MKANRKFVNGEEAVSAVIGVILMVAITVAIAATVYVYVSGMLPGPSGSQKTVGAITSSFSQSGNSSTFKVTETDPGIPWNEVACKYAKEGSSTTYTITNVSWFTKYGDTNNIAVSDLFTVIFPTDGTWVVDLVYKDSIIWTSKPVTV